MSEFGYKQTLRPRRRYVRSTPESRHSSIDKREKPRQSGAPVPNLIRPVRRGLAWPPQMQGAAGSTARLQLPESSQRLRPSYTVSPAGQRLKRRAPLPGAAQAVGRHPRRHASR